MSALTAGQWQDALHQFEKLLAERPTYRDVAERVRPLRKLAAGMKHLGPASGSATIETDVVETSHAAGTAGGTGRAFSSTSRLPGCSI
jgi:hypothetical protein